LGLVPAPAASGDTGESPAGAISDGKHGSRVAGDEPGREGSWKEAGRFLCLASVTVL